MQTYPPENLLSILVQIRIADDQGVLERALEEATRMTMWDYGLVADPGLQYDPVDDSFVEPGSGGSAT